MKQIPTITKSVSQPHKLAALQQAWQDWNSAPDVLTRLTRRLTTTLSLETQLGILSEEISSIVPFESLTYRHRIARQDFVFSTGMGGPHRAEYNLTLEGVSYGSLTFHRRHRFGEDELQAIEMLIGVAICPLRNACQHLMLEQTALTDALTGAPNKRAMDEALNRARLLADRHDETHSLILCDLDHFKAINDTHGHMVGDQILKKAVEVLERSLRSSDSIYRFGGEEFAVLLPHTGTQAAKDVADRIRLAMSNMTVEHTGQKIGVTTSCGVATYIKGESLEQWLARADEALYRAKREGRNRTRVFSALV